MLLILGRSLAAAAWVTSLVGCWQMQDLGQGQPFADDRDASDSGTDDTDTWPPIEEDAGIAHDPETELTWQNPALFQLLNWIEARDYCRDLEHAGYDDWRLPDVDELQTLLYGCADAHECGVDDPSCLQEYCNDGPDCGGCEDWEGPAPEGCYSHPAFDGWCEIYWSDSPAIPGFYRYWTVDFVQAKTNSEEIDLANAVRCVRDPE
jgi:hypothetical protein